MKNYMWSRAIVRMFRKLHAFHRISISLVYSDLAFISSANAEWQGFMLWEKKHSHKHWISHSLCFVFVFIHIHTPSVIWLVLYRSIGIGWVVICILRRCSQSVAQLKQKKIFQYNKIVNVPRIFNTEALKWAMRAKVQVCCSLEMETNQVLSTKNVTHKYFRM